jgi:type II secretory pathway component PulK
MIKTELISANTLRVVVPDKLEGDDFREIEPQLDSIIRQKGKIRLLIDASGFNGWENIGAFEKHAGFVKNHQQKVERIAVIAGHQWQHWLIGAVRVLVHPQVKAYDEGHKSEALKWLLS